ncbi:MAG: universal stress protein [Armatimonadetes bacterium]|nr:universal stress protein [Armatimonadota bacterium]
MKALVGLDLGPGDSLALETLFRLNFESADIHMAHAVEPAMPLSAFEIIPAGTVEEEYLTTMKEAGNKRLTRAIDQAAKRGFKTHGEVLFGPAAASLCHRADEGYDLLCVEAREHTGLERFVSGSVSQTLAVSAHQSVLIAKHCVKSEDPMTVILAVDHSPYCMSCIDQFLSWKPRGIDKIYVATAYNITHEEARILNANLTYLGQDAEVFVKTNITSKTEAIAERLRSAGYKAEAVVTKGEAAKVLSDLAKEKHADLTVLGARGHGFWDRLMMGSTSFAVLASCGNSVLILRIPKENSKTP